MSSERKSEPAAAPPHRRASFGATPGSRNRGFGSSDPERQREMPAPGERAAPAEAGVRTAGTAQAPGARAARRRPRSDGGGSG
jgi:hypothetical protein